MPRPILRRSAALAFVLVAAGTAGQLAAQSTPTPERLAFLVGRWEGEGWIERAPGQRHAFTQSERVERRLDGHVLVIEGVGWATVERGAPDRVTHRAFGILAHDPERDGYRMYAWRVDGDRVRFVDADAEVVEDGLDWGFATPQGAAFRYRLRHTTAGEWYETGEISLDGATWRPFLEMRLRRVQP